MKRRPVLMLPVGMMVAWIIALFISRQTGAIMILTVLTVILSILSFLFAVFLYKKDYSAKYIIIPVTFIICLVRFTNVDVRYNNWLNNGERIIDELEQNGAEGTVSRIEYKNDNTYIYVNRAVLNKDTVGILLLISGEEDYRPGMKLSFIGKGSLLPEPTNPGQFDSRQYYISKGIAFRMIDPDIKLLQKENVLMTFMYNVKEWLRLSIDMNAHPEDAGIYKAMLLGDKGDVSEEIKGLYQAGGISHILAISGLHVTFIGYIIFGVLRMLGLPIAGSSCVASIITLLYAVMVGAPVSALRAVFMLIISLAAQALGRTYDMCSALALSWMIVVLIYPMQLTQAGFQLSFGAIIAFSFIMPEISECLGYLKKRRFRGKPRRVTVMVNKLENSIIGSSVVSTVTWPVIAWHMYVITPMSIIVNIVVIPFMSLIMTNLLIAGLAGMLSVAGIIPSVRALWMPAHYTLVIYQKICEFTGKLRFGQIVVGRPRIISLVIYAILFTGIVTGVHFLNRVLEQKRELADYKGEKWDENRRGIKAAFRACIVIITIAMQLAGLFVLKRPREKNCLIFADVGQGDGALYFSGNTCIAIDGGSSFLEGIGTYRLEPAIMYMGYQKVDAWFLSHPDKDHVSGLIDILSDNTSPVSVESIVVPEASYGAEWKNIESVLGETQVIKVSEGDTYRWDTGRAEIIYPRKNDRADNVNDLCMVMSLMINDTKILFCGDISSDIEGELIKRFNGTDTLKADVLKVGHHGSKYSSSAEFLEAVSAGLAVISVGKNNYGHPAPETMERLQEAEMIIYTTIENGALIRYL